jgi:ribonuclease I
MNWRADAACKSRTNLFFPAPRERAEAQAVRVQKALVVCGGCSVRAECREQAEKIRASGAEVHGIWAGHDFGW